MLLQTKESFMSKLNIVVEYDDLGTNTNISRQMATLHIQDVLLANTLDKISIDLNNALEVGSDNKLYVNNADKLSTNYNYADSVTTMWSI